MPNMFMICGPGSPSVFTIMINGIEQQDEWVADALTKLEKEGAKTVEATPEEQQG
ncbi:hypothetical protein DFJ74DRAFT_709658 [Hyaloraphidium curvatum]|nr:hypothetical protein DFJ74DRAFT_709658 [Hyaloraphidium curvatum]